MIILIASNKGGSGKTTLATNLATCFAVKGDKEVCLVDADKQASAAKWILEREIAKHTPNITCVQKYDNLQPTLTSLASKYEIVIVDVAGRNSREMITAMAVADYVISPVQCSQLDLDTLMELNDQVVRVKDLNPNINVKLCHVMASTNSTVKDKEQQEFRDYIEEFSDLRHLNSVIYYRKIYRDVMSEGKSVIESANEQAHGEVQKIYEEVFNG